ncbi:hypothetical protein OK016_00505 [Vibrio chagasii]|nr:hypothetical protein [Vibrio chagasii]
MKGLTAASAPDYRRKNLATTRGENQPFSGDAAFDALMSKKSL